MAWGVSEREGGREGGDEGAKESLVVDGGGGDGHAEAPRKREKREGRLRQY